MTICPGEALGKPFDALEMALRRKKKTGERAEIGARPESPAVVASGGSPVGVMKGGQAAGSGIAADLQWTWGQLRRGWAQWRILGMAACPGQAAD